jgi:hypothetical protein
MELNRSIYYSQKWPKRRLESIQISANHSETTQQTSKGSSKHLEVCREERSAYMH